MPVLTAAAASDIFRSEPERFIETPVGDVACRRVGSGPDVLFVHGWPVSGATFRKLLPELAEHVTCHVIDLPGAGSSRFRGDAAVSIDTHIAAVKTVVDELGFDSVAAVGHDSGGMIARYALAGDPRLRSMGLVDTEQPRGLSTQFKRFLAMRSVPGFASVLGWVVAQPRFRRHKLLFGGIFADAALLDGEFDEFFLQPLHADKAMLQAAVTLLKSFDERYVLELDQVHEKIDIPVKLVWGDQDAFFPLTWAREMVATFPNATLEVIADAGLFSHEERPVEVAAALLPVLT